MIILIILLIQTISSTNINNPQVDIKVIPTNNEEQDIFKLSNKFGFVSIFFDNCKRNESETSCKQKKLGKFQLTLSEKNNLIFGITFFTNKVRITIKVKSHIQGKVILTWNSLNSKCLINFNKKKYALYMNSKTIIIDKLKEKVIYNIYGNTNYNGVEKRSFSHNLQVRFLKSGPVTNVEMIAANENSIIVSWSEPLNDKPGAYMVIYINNESGDRSCVLINLSGSPFTKSIQDSCVFRKVINRMQIYKFNLNNMEPYTKYNITILSINRKRRSVPVTKFIRTLEGKSGAVTRLRVDQEYRRTGRISIAFKKTHQPNGIIKHYIMNVTAILENICDKITNLIYFKKISSFQSRRYNSQYRMYLNYKKDHKYIIEVIPVNGWLKNNGYGQPNKITFSAPITATYFDSITASFISSNIISIKWKTKPKSNNVLGVVINLWNSEKCLSNVAVSSKYCSSLNQSIQSNQPSCENIHMLKKFNTGSILIEERYLPGTYYYIVIYPISDIIGSPIQTDVEIRESEIKDCFTDCTTSQSYYGIRSATNNGELCGRQKNSMVYQKSIRSKVFNLCRISLFIDYGSCKCDIPNCMSLSPIPKCVNDVEIFTTSSEISGSWSDLFTNYDIKGYLILLYNEFNECDKYIIIKYKSLTYMGIRVENFYISCKNLQSTENQLKRQFKFTGLWNNKEFKLYIIPIIDSDNVGSVKMLTMKTKPSYLVRDTLLTLGSIIIIAAVVLLLVIYRKRIKSIPFISKRLRKVFIEKRTDSNTISINEFEEYFNTMSENNSLALICQYKKLIAESLRLKKKLGLITDEERATINSKRNRMIVNIPIIRDIPFSMHYVNFNSIPFVKETESVEYLACQGPSDRNVDEFWDLIWKQCVSCVVMLTKTYENGKFKCYQYWPSSMETVVNYGNQKEIQVKVIEEVIKFSHIERIFMVYNEKFKQKRSVRQLQITVWTDFTKPTFEAIESLLFSFHDFSNKWISPPFIIHCSDGVGRTGSLITIDRIVRQLVTGTQEINIYDTVLNLRKHRCNMVHTQADYIFIHEYINLFLSTYMLTDNNKNML